MNLLYELAENSVDMLDELARRISELRERAHSSMSRIEGCACDEDAERYSYQVAECVGEAAYTCKDFWNAVCEMCEYAGVDKEKEA